MKNWLKFAFVMPNHPIDPYLDSTLIKAISSGIEKVQSSGDYFIYIEFVNGTKINAWNRNKYYAWLSAGTIDGYTWSDAMPSKSTMRKLYNALITL